MRNETVDPRVCETGARILVVDDDEAFRSCMIELLGQIGHECVGAASGEAALAALKSAPCEVAMTDLFMPGNYNLELIRSLNGLGVPVVLVTAYPEVRQSMEAAGVSVAGYLAKPVSFGELLSVLHAAAGVCAA